MAAFWSEQMGRTLPALLLHVPGILATSIKICSMDEQDRKAEPELSVGQTVGGSDHPYCGIAALDR